MQLTPAREQAASGDLLNVWLRRHNGYLFNIVPLQAGDPANDSQENHRQLMRLLTEKNIVRSFALLTISSG